MTDDDIKKLAASLGIEPLQAFTPQIGGKVYLTKRGMEAAESFWMRAYSKAILAGKSEAEAIEMADDRLQEARDDV